MRRLSAFTKSHGTPHRPPLPARQSLCVMQEPAACISLCGKCACCEQQWLHLVPRAIKACAVAICTPQPHAAKAFQWLVVLRNTVLGLWCCQAPCWSRSLACRCCCWSHAPAASRCCQPSTSPCAVLARAAGNVTTLDSLQSNSNWHSSMQASQVR